MTVAPRAALTAALVSAASIAAAAPPEPMPITDAAGAARATALAMNSYSYATRYNYSFVDGPRYLVVNTLGLLRAQTTPEAAAGRRGVTINCPASGTLRAHFPANNPNVLRLYWNNCVVPQNPATITITYHGEARLRLPSQTFTPEYLEAMHLGDEIWPLVQSQADQDYPQDLNEQFHDVHLVGRLPLTRFRGVGIFTGAFDYVLNGTVETNYVSASDPLIPPFSTQSFTDVHDLRASGSAVHSENDTVLDEVLTIHRGSYSLGYSSYDGPLVPDAAFTAYTWKVTRGIRVADRTSTHTVDGRVDYQWPPFTGTCGNGVYSFRTVVPIRQADVFSWDARDQGEVVVNQSARATFSLTDEATTNPPWHTPRPGEPVTKVVIKQGKTQLLATTSYFIGSTLQDIGSCTN